MNKEIWFTDEFKQDAMAQVVERGYAVKGKRRLHPIDILIEFGGFAVGALTCELAGESRTSSFRVMAVGA